MVGILASLSVWEEDHGGYASLPGWVEERDHGGYTSLPGYVRRRGTMVGILASLGMYRVYHSGYTAPVHPWVHLSHTQHCCSTPPGYTVTTRNRR